MTGRLFIGIRPQSRHGFREKAGNLGDGDIVHQRQ